MPPNPSLSLADTIKLAAVNTAVGCARDFAAQTLQRLPLYTSNPDSFTALAPTRAP